MAATSVIQSTIDSAAALGMSTADQDALLPIAKRYQRHLNKLAEAIEAGDNKAAKHWQLKILKSDDAKISALVRTAYLKDIISGIALAEVVPEAWALDLNQAIPGVIIARPEPKPEGGVRVVTSVRLETQGRPDYLFRLAGPVLPPVRLRFPEPGGRWRDSRHQAPHEPDRPGSIRLRRRRGPRELLWVRQQEEGGASAAPPRPASRGTSCL